VVIGLKLLVSRLKLLVYVVIGLRLIGYSLETIGILIDYWLVNRLKVNVVRDLICYGYLCWCLWYGDWCVIGSIDYWLVNRLMLIGSIVDQYWLLGWD
jgi:hypothetical protein